MGTLFGKVKVVFIKTKRFYENLEKDVSDSSEFYKRRCSGGEKVDVYVFRKKMVLMKTTQGSL